MKILGGCTFESILSGAFNVKLSFNCYNLIVYKFENIMLFLPMEKSELSVSPFSLRSASSSFCLKRRCQKYTC